jgi:hyaluronan synthase
LSLVNGSKSREERASINYMPKIQFPSSAKYPKDFNVKISGVNEITVTTKVWIIRISMLILVSFLVAYRLYQGIIFHNPLVIGSTITPIISTLMLIGAWFLYKNPSKQITIYNVENDLISVIIPIYNQRNIIGIVIDAMYRSNYKNIEVIAVDDGSTDGTKEILDHLTCRYVNFRVIHQKRGGKRKAIATGFYASKGQYLLHIDSDSIIDENAITEIMKVFNANRNVGSITGELKIWYANKNFIMKMQDAMYDFSCNINKACESAFKSVTCCSGSLAAYRRDVVVNFMSCWMNSNRQCSNDNEVDRAVKASLIEPKVSKDFLPALWPLRNLKLRLMKSAIEYDDADDRLLTAQSLTKWESVYVSTAIAYVEAQDTWKSFIKQQIRWTKGFLRSNLYLGMYFWRKRHPIISIVYYLDVISCYAMPITLLTVLIYEPLALEQAWTSLVFVGFVILSALAHGIDTKLRWSESIVWKYMPLMNVFRTFVLSWLLLVALWNFRKNSWMTR